MSIESIPPCPGEFLGAVSKVLYNIIHHIKSRLPKSVPDANNYILAKPSYEPVANNVPSHCQRVKRVEREK